SKLRSNSSTSPGKKTFRTLCRKSVLNELFSQIPGSCCASLASGIDKLSLPSYADNDVFDPPNSRSPCHDTSGHGSARCLVTVGSIRVLFRAGVGELSRLRAYG